MTMDDHELSPHGAENVSPGAENVTANPWEALRRFTAARIALGRSGVSLPTAPQLAFQLAHAQARDAVHLPLDVAGLKDQLQQQGICAAQAIPDVRSAAADRLMYLQRPDFGRKLSESSRQQLLERFGTAPQRRFDVGFVIADGLSALAIVRNAAPFLAQVMQRIASEGWSMAPPVIVQQGRVAVADEIGELLGVKLVVILIGERPGLSSPDSMGLYLTWMPSRGLTDASRNCISNVRPEGLPYAEAAYKLHYLMAQAHERGLSGVALKDETASAAEELDVRRNFLLGGD
ncbi:ethanolamine ammonia-lyase small subunit [Herbaspirillum sp. GW103]|uniref:ethanolamine ammonia-lyase subunit EutC n=1 Tax=unclassified Herbaspirillum TaxID=2624150 RepID=UPI00025E3E08|nr:MULTISPECIES: ethanolamine ammonia-lyase subunit EutC [unclassified Herbaspirillum]EIJ47732.1 ethanolamine ammonia-lyase small subunit [Herbaspirillum sp. GW103]MCI1005732.1 ethanolamine ammonia-lyase subunit EutC [Herbaspirillum sp. C7C8]